MIGSRFYGVSWFGTQTIASAIFGLPAGFLTIWIVSLLTAPPPQGGAGPRGQRPLSEVRPGDRAVGPGHRARPALSLTRRAGADLAPARATSPCYALIYRLLVLVWFLSYMAAIYLALHMIVARFTRAPDSRLLWFFSVITGPLTRPARAWVSAGASEGRVRLITLLGAGRPLARRAAAARHHGRPGLQTGRQVSMLRLAGTNALAIVDVRAGICRGGSRWLTQGAFLASLAVFFISLTALWVYVERSRPGPATS